MEDAANGWNENEHVRLMNKQAAEKNNWKELENMDKQKVLNELRNAKDVYVLVSRCTRMPYVVCDPETFDDEILVYFREEDVKKEGARMIEEKNPIQIVRVEENQRLRFYANLYTMGVNSILVDKGLESETLIQLTELVTRPDPSKLPKGQILVENPGLHLTALYFMQEVRKQKLEKLTDELKEMQEEILADYSRSNGGSSSGPGGRCDHYGERSRSGCFRGCGSRGSRRGWNGRSRRRGIGSSRRQRRGWYLHQADRWGPGGDHCRGRRRSGRHLDDGARRR